MLEFTSNSSTGPSGIEIGRHSPAQALVNPFRIGAWRADPARHQLTLLASADVVRRIEPRLMHLLSFLAANPARVLTREELVNELWPRVVVNDNSLTRAVSELRKALDGPRVPGSDYLQTIPKRGYRLNDWIQVQIEAGRATRPSSIPDEPTDELRAESDVSLPSESPKRRWVHPTLPLLACLSLVAITAGLIESPTRNSPTTEPIAGNSRVFDQVVEPMNKRETGFTGGRLSLSALNSDHDLSGGTPADNNDPQLSADGTLEAFVRYDQGLSRIFIAPVTVDDADETGDAPYLLLSSDDYLYNLQWSPVGNALLFAREKKNPLPAFLGTDSNRADLIMLDLDTMRLRVLIDNSPAPRDPTSV